MRTPGAAATSPPDAGLSLVEVMVAMAVFAIGSLSLLTVLSSSTGSTFDNRARLTAAGLAAADIDESRSTPYADLVVGTSPTRTVTVDGRVYSVVREVAVTLASGTAATSACVTSGSARQLHKRVSTSVTTSWRGRTKPVRADTIVKAPVFDPNSPNGAIGFLVMDRTGQPQTGLPVAVPGKSRNTDSSGCAFLDQLAPGAYTVTVTKSGAVRRDGSSSLTKTVVVNPGQVTSDSLRIDTGISVTVRARAFTGTSPTAGTWHVPNGGVVSLTAPDRTMTTAITLPETKVLTGADLQWSSSVYPSPGGYDAYWGSCHPVVHFDSEPSTSPVVDLRLSPIVVHIKANSQDLPKSRSVTATWVPTPTRPAPCTEVLTWPVLTAGDCHGQHNLDGGARPCRLDLALPEGRWTIRPSGANGASTTLTGSAVLDVTAGTANSHFDLQVS